MADNRYNVDDILAELNQKQRTAPPPPQREWEPVVPPAPRGESPRRTQAAPPPEPAPARRPLRQPPTGATANPRLGQTLQPPRNREEMGKLLNRFDDSREDPLGDLDFLSRQPDPVYAPTPADNFVPDWDRQDYRAPSGRQPAAPPPQGQPSQQPYGRPPQQPQPRTQRPPQSGYAPEPSRVQQGNRARPDPRGYTDPNYGEQPRQPRPTSKMYHEDRRNMADAARLITSGGFGDLPEEVRQPAPVPRGRSVRQDQPVYRQPVQQEQPVYRQPVQQDQPVYRQSVQQDQPIYRQPVQQDQPVYRQPVQQEQPVYRQPVQQEQPPARQAARPAQPNLRNTAIPGPEELFGTAPAEKPQGESPRARRPERTEPPRQEAARTAPPREEAGEAGRRGGNQQVAQQLQKMRTSLLLRVVVNLLALAGVVYLVLSAGYQFPLPEFLQGEENRAVFLWSMVGVIIVSAIVSGNAVGGGMLALLRLRPSNDSYTALAVFACLIQGSYMAMQPQLMENYGDNLYLPMAALMLLFNTLGKLIMLSRMGGSFGFIAAKGEKHVADIMDNREFARRISGDIVGDEPRIAYFTDSLNVDGFLEQAFSESKAEDISKVIAPLTALAALVMALVSYLLHRDIFNAACVYTAALCITAPLAGVIASNLPLSITNGKLARFGASLCGYDAVSRFSDVGGVLLCCSQLFPKGSVSIQDIKVLDRRPIDQVIVDAASVLCSCDSDLSGIFRDMVPDSGILPQPENLEYFDDMGLSAWVNGRRVLIGNRNLMVSYGVAIPGVEFERPYTTGNNEVLYLANSGEAAAMYVLAYRADKSMRRAMELLCDRDMAVCVYSTDPNLTAEKISSLYSFPKELLSIIPASMQAGSERYMGVKGRVKASVVHNGSPASYLRTILAAQSCGRCITLETALILVSVVLGFAIVTFFAFTQQMEALTWISIAVYQFFWLLLELAIPLVKH